MSSPAPDVGCAPAALGAAAAADVPAVAPKTEPDLTACPKPGVSEFEVVVEPLLIAAVGEDPDPLVDEPPPRCGRLMEASRFFGVAERKEYSSGVLSADDTTSSTGPFWLHDRVLVPDRTMDDGSGDRFTRLRLLAFLCSWSLGLTPPTVL